MNSNNLSNRFPAAIADDLTLKFVNPARLKNYLLPLKGQTVEIVVGKSRRRRSDEQNRYYWAVVVQTVADCCGYRGADEIEALHAELKRRFLPGFGRLGIARSTAALNTKEFNDYIDAIKTWAAAELNIYIPDPDESEATL